MDQKIFLTYFGRNSIVVINFLLTKVNFITYGFVAVPCKFESTYVKEFSPETLRIIFSPYASHLSSGSLPMLMPVLYLSILKASFQISGKFCSFKCMPKSRKYFSCTNLAVGFQIVYSILFNGQHLSFTF
jgi:hypothetical protein